MLKIKKSTLRGFISLYISRSINYCLLCMHGNYNYAKNREQQIKKKAHKR